MRSKTTDQGQIIPSWVIVPSLIAINKATARLATRGNSWIVHDAWFTKSWYLQGFVKT